MNYDYVIFKLKYLVDEQSKDNLEEHLTKKLDSVCKMINDIDEEHDRLIEERKMGY